MYRNVVLTVIALCLLWICARDIVPWGTVQAGAALEPRGKRAEPVPVVIQADARSPVPVSIQAGRTPLAVRIEDVVGGALRRVEPVSVRTTR